VTGQRNDVSGDHGSEHQLATTIKLPKTWPPMPQPDSDGLAPL